MFKAAIGGCYNFINNRFALEPRIYTLTANNYDAHALSQVID